ncbi:hypothetical protein J4734_29325, partial [Klebsiella pneumoniae]|nr:hypothetical protein [Klebsiella pneumoniae]
VGGIDPVIVKYFAFKNGVKYLIRGEEHIIVGSEGFGGEKAPVPDFNLRNDKSLLKHDGKMGFYFHNKNKLNYVVSCQNLLRFHPAYKFLRRNGEVVYSTRYAFCDFR